MRITYLQHTTRPVIALVLFVAWTLLSLAGCADLKETTVTRPSDRFDGGFDPTAQSNEPVDPAILDQDFTVKPIRKTSTTTRAVAAVKPPIGSVQYDGNLLPLVDPEGQYIAAQEPPMVPWNIIFGRDVPTGPGNTSIVIYQFQPDDIVGVTLKPVRRVRNAGIIGRDCNGRGFLVEKPMDDGSRKIGFVEWESGEVTWLIDDGYVNSFASMNGLEQLTWCRRMAGADGYELVVETDDGGMITYAAPTRGDWLFPVWSSDGYTIFAMRVFEARLGEKWQLDIAGFDARGEGLRNGPFASRTLILENASRSKAFGTLAGFQSPVSPHAPARLAFFHPGTNFGRVCLFDPATEGLQLMAEKTIGGAWDGEGLVLASESNVFRQDASLGARAFELIGGPYVVRSTNSPLCPFVLLTPSRKDSRGRLDVMVMDVITDLGMLDELEQPFN